MTANTAQWGDDLGAHFDESDRVVAEVTVPEKLQGRFHDLAVLVAFWASFWAWLMTAPFTAKSAAAADFGSRSGIPAVERGVGRNMDLARGFRSLSADKQGRVTPDMVRKWQALGLSRDEIELMSFAYAANVVTAIEFAPVGPDNVSTLNSIDNSLALTLPFKKTARELGIADLTPTGYNAMIDLLYGPERIPTARWKQAPVDNPDGTVSFRDLTTEEVARFDESTLSQAPKLKAAFAKLAPEEQQWMVDFIKDSAGKLEAKGTLSAETARRIGLMAGAFRASKNPSFFPGGPLSISAEEIASMDPNMRKDRIDRVRRLATDAANYDALIGGQTHMKLTTALGYKWPIVNESTIKNTPALAHLAGLSKATMETFIVDVSGNLRSALSMAQTDVELAAREQQGLLDKQQGLLDKQQGSAMKKFAEYTIEINAIDAGLQKMALSYPGLSVKDQKITREKVSEKMARLIIIFDDIRMLKGVNPAIEGHLQEFRTGGLKHINLVLAQMGIKAQLSV